MAVPSKYITRDGYTALENELYQLWKVERPAITQSVQEAAAQGDRSENAAYIYGKKRMREIDRRVRYLSRRLDGMTVVNQPPDDPSRIFFGAWVTLENETGETFCWRIVGPDEIDPAKHYISIDSPVARSLMGRQADDDIMVTLPKGQQHYRVIKVSYP